VIGKRKCKCVRKFTDKTFRMVDVVTNENASCPIYTDDPEEWARYDCPECKGAGWIEEQALTPREVEAMIRDFDKRIARR
jgi:hypothetical protein